MVADASPSIPITFPPKPLVTWVIDSFDRLLFPLTGRIVPYSLNTRRLLHQAEALSTPQDPWPDVLGGDAAHQCFMRELRYFFSVNIFASCPGSLTVLTMTALTWNINNNIPLYPCDEDELADTIQKHHGTILGQMEFLLGRELLRGLDARHAMAYDPKEAQEDGMESISGLVVMSSEDVTFYTSTASWILISQRFLGANGIFLGGDIITGGAYQIQTGSPEADPNRFHYHFLFLRVFYQLWQKNWRGAPVKRWIIKTLYYTRDLADCLTSPAILGGPKAPVAALVGCRDARDMIPSEATHVSLCAS
ncbi:hypothetical protein M427DRAFT_33312 [Gonapodya prolifera JEL478]|uniref:Uncharacterized protein n=1 Tax=Gonapodya prolifera (strain JEL478) TaxID=1344416 RepID=A0A139ABP6_GONPJ|nr:hypothetical protein M427DRAFT_33312 [Gonapodya prolifera JEL478]|eukprot:KXS14099.1 hypothetical protein M427DRAFT_33312 [Gonapodya prolifera JEL478]